MAVHLRHSDESAGDVHEINVTPFIDVMLVLLVIFMVAAPLATVTVPVELPSSTQNPEPQPEAPVFLTVRADHGLALGNDAITAEKLESGLDSATGHNRDTRIFLRADKSVDYGTLMDVMGQLRKAGYLKVALVGLQNEAEGATPP
jgi:biopolymer transport protein ExbD